MMLPVTHMLAFGERQRLCGLPERDMRLPEAPQGCYMAVSLASAWLVTQSKATPGEYREEAEGEFGHISERRPSPRALPQPHRMRLALVWRRGPEPAPGSP